MLHIDRMVTEIKTHNGVVRAVDGVSVEIQPGEIFALVGESGCGKSMTALSIMRLLPETGTVSEGTVTVDDQEIMGLPESLMRQIRARKIGIIFQEPATSLNPVMTVGDQILETIRLHTSLRGEEAREEAIEWLRKVGLPNPEQRMEMFPHEMSGGQKQRIMIAMVLAAKPDFLIADEPTTALDVTIQAQILELLKSLRDSEGIGILLITHDLAVVAQVADKVGLMYAGQLIEVAKANEFFNKPLHPYARSLLQALPDGKRKGKDLEAVPGVVPSLTTKFVGCRFAPRCSRRKPECTASEIVFDTTKNHPVRCLYPSETEVDLRTHAVQIPLLSESHSEILKVSDYSVSFPINSNSLFRRTQYRTVVDKVSFSVKKGMTTALIGESGSGKTTVARGILQLLRDVAKTEGMALLNGVDLERASEKDLRQIRSKIQVIFQDPFSSLNPRMRVREILQEGLIHLRPDIAKAEALDRIEDMLLQCGLRSDALTRYPHEFSGGQRQRLAIARALVVEPQLLICDEPTSALDVSVQAQILNLLNHIQEERELSYLFITHNFGVVRYLADEVVVMQNGKIVEQGKAWKILNDPQTEYTKRLLVAVPNFDGLENVVEQ